jgi:DNA-binding transcriptional regulator LsrR (DeoR family)
VCGGEVPEPLGDRVIGLDSARLKNISRVVGVAGGNRNHQAILAALQGQWVNVLITDQFSAKALLMA